MKTIYSTLFALLTSFATSAFADCVMDGNTYRTGQRVGPYTCLPDGSWRK